MLNYLSAELWRMTRRRSALLLWGIYLLLVFLIGLTLRGTGAMTALENFRNFMLMGIYLAFSLADWAIGGAVRAGSLTNEVSFGLPRVRIYLGKLSAALLVGVLLFLLTTAVFFLGALSPSAVLELSEEDRALVSMDLLISMLHSLPRYVGAVSLAYFLVFTLRPAGAGTILYYLYITIGELTLAAVRVMGMGVVGNMLNHLAEAVRPFLLTNAYFVYSYGNVPPTLGNSWLTGALWLGVTTGLGLLLLRRREIR